MEKAIQNSINSNEAVLINFKTNECNPCQMMTPTLQQVKNAIGNRVLVYNLDVNEAPNLAEQYQITTLPMLVLFFEGQIVWQTKAVLSKEEIIKNVLEHSQ